jgi:hypothetical protein
VRPPRCFARESSHTKAPGTEHAWFALFIEEFLLPVCTLSEGTSCSEEVFLDCVARHADTFIPQAQRPHSVHLLNELAEHLLC